MLRSKLGARRGWIAGAHLGPGRLVRHHLLKGACGLAGLAALGGAVFAASCLVDGNNGEILTLRSQSTGPARALRSRSDLRPPVVAMSGGVVAPAYPFLGPKDSGGSQPGRLPVDHGGEPVWFKPLASSQWTTNLRVAQYRGERVLIWWEGRGRVRQRAGEAMIVDSSYYELARVRAGSGRQVDCTGSPSRRGARRPQRCSALRVGDLPEARRSGCDRAG